MALAFVGESSNPASLSGTAGTTQTCVRTVTAGNALIAYAVGISGSGTTVTFSDSAGNTWTTAKVVLPLGGGFQVIAVGYAMNVAAGSTTVTATFNASAHHMGVILVEVSGAKTASALEGAGGQYQGTPGTSANAITSGNPTPAPTTTANAFVCGFTCNFNNNVAPTAVGTGFTQTGAVKWTAQMGGVQGEYKIVGATGTYPATFTSGVTNDNWTTLVIVLAEASGGGITGTGTAAAQPFAAAGSGVETFTGTGSAAAKSFGATGSGGETFTGSGTAAASSFGASGSGTVLPVPVSGLKLWLRGDAGIHQSGGNVTQWDDQSGNGNDVANVGTVPYAASSINGLPGLTFGGTQIMSSTTNNVVPSGSARTVFVVAKASGATGGPLFQFRTAVPNEYAVFLCGATYPTYGAVAGTDGVVGVFYSTPPTVSGVATIVEESSSSAASAIAVKLNGTSQALAGNPFVASDTAATGFLVGGWSQPGSQQYIGDICEVLVYDSVLSAGDATLVRNYLGAKYGISVGSVTGTGSASVQPFAASGAGTETFTGTGSAAARSFAASGAGAETFSGSGSTATKPFGASGSGSTGLPITGSGSAALKSFGATGAGFTGPAETPLPPPFTTVVDPVVLSTWVDSVQLTVAVDAVRLSLGERLKPRKTTDTYPITNTLLSNGVAVNLTGYTVTINIVERASRTPKRANGACTLTDAVNGKVSYAVVAGDVDTAGTYDVEWKAVSGGGVPYHFPQDGYEPLEIQPALG